LVLCFTNAHVAAHEVAQLGQAGEVPSQTLEGRPQLARGGERAGKERSGDAAVQYRSASINAR
jgi:hypothetical protein